METSRSLSTLSRRARECLAAGSAVAVVGIGSELRGDDAAGVRIAELVRQSAPAGVHAFIGGGAPENVTGEVLAVQPGLIVFVDAADLGAEPGAVRLIEPDQIQGVSFSTHTLPLSVIISYLASSCRAEFLVVGIQPRATDFCTPLSREAQAAVEAAAEALCAAGRPQPAL